MMNPMGNIPNTRILNESMGLKTELDLSKKLDSLVKAVKSQLQSKEMETNPSVQEKKPSLLQQGKKAIGDAWTEGKKEVSSRLQNLGLERMLQTHTSRILERLKENHRTTNQNANTGAVQSPVVDTPSFPAPIQTLLDLAKKTEPSATPEELKEAGKAILKFTTSLDTESLKTISKNLNASQLSNVIMGALDQEIEGHVSAGNVLRENTSGNQLLTEFALVHLSKEFNRSPDLQSLLGSIPKESLNEGAGFNETAVPEATKFMDTYLSATKSLLGSQTEEMALFKEIIKDTASSIDTKFGAEIGAGGTAGVNLLFLRVLNPIIITPEAKGITLDEKRTPDQTKNAILFVKVAQNMANNIKYSETSKESKMVVFNELLEAQETNMNEVKQLLVS